MYRPHSKLGGSLEKYTVEIWADEETAGLTAGDSLLHSKDRRAESVNAFALKNSGRVQTWARGEDLDAEPLPWNSQPMKFFGV
jgi:hypothetical protein